MSTDEAADHDWVQIGVNLYYCFTCVNETGWDRKDEGSSTGVNTMIRSGFSVNQGTFSETIAPRPATPATSGEQLTIQLGE